jgi:hypothetical protein
MEEILKNSWVIGIGTGVVVLFLGWLCKRMFFPIKEKTVDIFNANNQSQKQEVVVNNFMNRNKETQKTYTRSIPSNKNEVKILFVDDDTTFKIIDILKNSGWKNTSIVNDITDVDSIEVKNTDIFFIDIKGVAKWLSEKHQGLALAEKIKDKYSEKKVVIYSSDIKGDRSHSALQKVDWFLPKYAEPADFFSVIERFTAEE